MTDLRKRELFKDFINGLMHIELDIFYANSGKLHETELELFETIQAEIKSNDNYSDSVDGVDKRTKNRLKNKIQSTLDSIDLEQNEKLIKHKLSDEADFFNVSELKKLLRKLFKSKVHIQSIHSLIVLSDQLRNFYVRHKERNEITEYYNLLSKNDDFLDFNLGVSYFLRTLDIKLHNNKDLDVLDNEVKKIRSYLESKELIGGYSFKLYDLLIQHWINVGEWEEAERVADQLESKMREGYMYTSDNLMRLYSFKARIYNQTYQKDKYNYFVEELDKKQSNSLTLETDLINERLIVAYGDEEITKNVLNRIERVANEVNSEKTNLYLRLARTDLALKNGDFKKAKSYNELFFMDIHNKQVRDFLDKVYIQRFKVLYHLKDHEEVVRLFESKVTQKRILSLERKGKLLIYPYIIYDIAKYSIGEQTFEESFENIHRMIEFYQFNNRFDCYHMLSECIQFTEDSLKLEEKSQLALNRLKSMVTDTLKKL